MLLRETINDLLDNAIRYMLADGHATLRIGMEADVASERWGAVSVEDGGPGILSERCSEVFQRFFHGDADHHSGQPQGSGLGLTIMRDVVRLHDGTATINDVIVRDGGRVMRFVLHLSLTDDAV